MSKNSKKIYFLNRNVNKIHFNLDTVKFLRPQFFVSNRCGPKVGLAVSCNPKYDVAVRFPIVAVKYLEIRDSRDFWAKHFWR